MNKKHLILIVVVVSLLFGSILASTALSNDVLAASKCGGANTSIISCGNNGVWGLLSIAINILTAGVFIAALGGIIYGAVMYTTAGGSQEQTKKAKEILTNVVIGMIAFAMMFAVLQWLIPGGLFNSSGDIDNVPEMRGPSQTNQNTNNNTNNRDSRADGGAQGQIAE